MISYDDVVFSKYIALEEYERKWIIAVKIICDNFKEQGIIKM
jgi:hypothetical protein